MLIFILLSVTSFVAHAQESVTRPYTFLPPASYKGLAYSGFRKEGPPTETLEISDIKADMALLASNGVKWIRTYSMEMGQEMIPSIAKDAGIETFIGLSITETTTLDTLKVQVAQLEELFRKDDRLAPIVVVGNELIYEKVQSVDNLASFVKFVQSRGFRAAIADTPAVLLNEANVPALKQADIILLHIHPFFEKVQDNAANLSPHSRLMPDAAAAEYVVKVVQKTAQTYSPQLVLLGETGWPRQDDTPHSNPDHCRWCTPQYQKDFLTILANRVVTNDIGMFLFEAFDESWKSHVAEEGGAAPYWGVFFANRAPTPALEPIKAWLSSDSPIPVDVDGVCAGMEAMAECIPSGSADDGKVQELLDKMCSQGRVICQYMDLPLMAKCSARAKASWALSQFYQLQERRRDACDFDGAATVKPVVVSVENGISQPIPIIEAVAQLPEDGEGPATTLYSTGVRAAGLVWAVLVVAAIAVRTMKVDEPSDLELEMATGGIDMEQGAAPAYGSMGDFLKERYVMLD